MRKGQISIFIIIGIIILIATAFVLFISSGEKVDIDESPDTSDIDRVRSHISSCLEYTLNDAVFLIGIQGGYIYPIYYKDYIFFKRSFLYYRDMPYVPSVEIMEDELSEYIDANLKTCINVSKFPGYVIELGEVDTMAHIQNKSVYVDTHFPVSLRIGDGLTEFDVFSAEVDSKISYFRDIAEEIIFRHIADESFMDYSYLAGLDMNVSVSRNSRDGIVYSLMDNKTGELFSFVEQFNYSFDENSAPILLDKIEDLEAPEGIYFYHKIIVSDAENDPLTFVAETDMFDINNVGEIRFIPRDKGLHIIPFYVEDIHGAQDIGIMRLNVI